MPRLTAPDPPLPVIFTTRQALAAGLSRDQIRHRLRAGRWVRVGRGHYRRSDWSPDQDDAGFSRERIDHAHRAIAAVLRNPGCVIGFASAAIIHQLPLFEVVPGEVALIAAPGAWTGRRSGIVFRQAALGSHEVTGRRVPVTTPDRSWLDVARTGSLAGGIAAGDGGLRLGAFSPDSLRSALDECGSARRCRRAALALDHVSALRESALESGSWAYFVEYRIPLPRMQVPFRTTDGRLIGRVDFWWESAGLVGECDGRLKYSTAADVFAEKVREDALREAGQRVIRWGWRDLADAGLAVRLRRALAAR